MLPWWGWLVLWSVLLAGSALWLFVLSRRVWRKAAALSGELSRASALVSELEERADGLRDEDPPVSAVTQHPSELRRRYREQRAEQSVVRRSLRAERMPRWARVD